MIRLVVIAVLLVVVPVAGAAGTAGYTGAAERIRAESATKVVVPAIILQASTLAVPSDPNRAAGYEALVS
ncbi:hypothetical protein [Nocardia crassostreae]|uniref:hypothetical protein n=1 Tax=Nocardia crassostreae TaxID=53428 RepID=UPI0012F7FA9D|nr:hypothetical protein [Nocardia crassostreae]